MLADGILSEIKEVCLLCLRLLRCVNKEIRQSQPSIHTTVHNELLSPFRSLRLDDVNTQMFEKCAFKEIIFLYFNLQADGYCPYLWFSEAPCSLKSPKELPFGIITPAVLYGSQFERGLEFPPTLMRLFFFFKVL